MLKILEMLKKNNEICCNFSNQEETNRFSLGYIIGLDEKFYLFEHISPTGENDGISCRQVDKIYKIETQNSYTNKIIKLFNSKNNSRYTYIDSGKSVMLSLLQYALINKKICNFELYESQDDDAVGFIKKSMRIL